jgi:hypothetical protein
MWLLIAYLACFAVLLEHLHRAAPEVVSEEALFRENQTGEAEAT